MYRAFDVNLVHEQYWSKFSKFYDYNDSIVCAMDTLRMLINSSKEISANQIKQILLPKEHYDIFISHSHKDLLLAKGLAGYLRVLCGLSCFIDSLYWGNIDELQEELNRMHLHKDEVTGKKYFNHKSTMEVAKHANMILASALTEMIDNCECVFFLNTDNSVIRGTEAISKNETYSPWIYHEVFTTSIIHRRKTDRRAALEEQQIRNNAIKPLPQFIYNLDLTGMTILNDDDIIRWRSAVKYDYNNNPLDVLYNLNPELN